MPIKIASSKVSRNNKDISTREITPKKLGGNNVDFPAIKIASKKIVRGNNMDFSTIKITSRKVHRNNVDFSASVITPKNKRGNKVEFFGEIWSSTYQRNIDIESTLIRLSVPVGYLPKQACS